MIKGSETATVGGGRGGSETAPIKEGDAAPIQLTEVHWFENTGSEPLELTIIGLARDMSKRVDSIEAGAGHGGRRRSEHPPLKRRIPPTPT